MSMLLRQRNVTYSVSMKRNGARSNLKRRELADKVRRSYSGETVLICWHHGAIPDLLRAFGANPKALLPGGDWPDDVFGWLIVLRYDQNGRASANVSNERINPDDAKHPPPQL